MRRNQVDPSRPRISGSFALGPVRPGKSHRWRPAVDSLEDRRLLSNVIPDDLLGELAARPALRFDRLSNDLIDLYREVKVADGANRQVDLSAYFSNKPAPLIFKGDNVGVTVTTSNALALLPSLQALGFQTTVSLPDRNVIEGFLPVGALDDVTMLGPQGLLGVIGIASPQTGAGAVLSQADFTLQASRTRLTAPPGVTGAGVKIGVISDSFNRLGGAAADIASGDLPNNVVNFLEGPASGVSDEGRAMTQLVFDLAPGSPLAFGSAFFGQAGFGQLIKDLANPANFGAKVITDDIFYFEEPLFQDGLIAQGIDDVVTNRDVAYFALAGNLSNQSYESTNIGFSNQVIAPISAVARDYFDFDPGAGVDTRQRVTVGSGQSAILNLQWDEPFFTAGGVSTDLDIFVIDTVTNTVVASSVRNNPAIQQPSEILSWTNATAADRGYDIVIQRFSGRGPGRVKWVNYGANNSLPITVVDFPTNSPTAIPHSSALGLSVGAAASFDQRTAESFSSIGPNTILFNADGSAKAVAEVRQTPDITSTDGTSTTFFGPNFVGLGFLFFGTSAAAPHAAAVAALLRQAEPALTANQVYARMTSTASDIGVAGFDNKTGFGLVDAYKAIFGPTQVAKVNTTDGFESGVLGKTWEVFNSGSGRTQVTNLGTPAAGTRHLVLDSVLPGGFITPGLSEAVLSVDLANRTGVSLTYSAKRFAGEVITPLPASFANHVNGDGISFSVDGANWFRIDALAAITVNYQNFTINLSAAATNAGVVLSANTRIKFQRFEADSGQVAADGLAFDNVSVSATTTLTTTQIDDGTIQRSRLRSFTFDFVGNIASFSAVPPAFLLQRSDGLTIPLILGPGTVVGNGLSHLVLIPTGPDLQGGSIPDGNYVLTVDGSRILDDAGNMIDAAGNGVRGSSRTLNFHRFFGDGNGDGLVDATDYLAFRTAYLTGNAASAANSIYDFNGDGVFSLNDLTAFNTSFRKRRLTGGS